MNQAGAAAPILLKHRTNREPAEIPEVGQVVLEQADGAVDGQVRLRHVAFQLSQQMRPPFVQRPIQPVLGIEKHLAVRFPHPVALEPGPHARQIVARGKQIRLQIHQPALHEQLHGTDRLLEARRPHVGPHIDVEQEQCEQIRRTGHVIAKTEVAGQRRPLPFAQPVHRHAERLVGAGLPEPGHDRRPRIGSLGLVRGRLDHRNQTVGRHPQTPKHVGDGHDEAKVGGRA